MCNRIALQLTAGPHQLSLIARGVGGGALRERRSLGPRLAQRRLRCRVSLRIRRGEQLAPLCLCLRLSHDALGLDGLARELRRAQVLLHWGKELSALSTLAGIRQGRTPVRLRSHGMQRL